MHFGGWPVDDGSLVSSRPEFRYCVPELWPLLEIRQPWQFLQELARGNDVCVRWQRPNGPQEVIVFRDDQHRRLHRVPTEVQDELHDREFASVALDRCRRGTQTESCR